MPAEKRFTTRIAFYASDALIDRIDNVAKEEGLSRSAASRLLISRQLRYREWKRRGKPKRKSKSGKTKVVEEDPLEGKFNPAYRGHPGIKDEWIREDGD